MTEDIHEQAKATSQQMEGQPSFDQEAMSALGFSVLYDFGRGDLDGAKRKIHDAVLNQEQTADGQTAYELSSEGRQEVMKFLKEQIETAPVLTEKQTQDQAELIKFIDELSIPALTVNKRRQQNEAA